MNRFLIFIFVIFISTNIFAQKINDSLLIFHARIISADSAQPLHNAHIISKFNKWGTISNKNGEFKMLVSNVDSLLVSSIGFSPKVLRIDTSLVNFDEPYEIIMYKDTILINEIVIHAFWDYRTFKQLIVNMEPLNLDNFYPNWEGTELLYKDPRPLTFKGPIQALYDVFNQSAKLRRQLIKNRREYNKLMMQMGRPNDTIPAYPAHIRDGY
jgi:hypothetical protein